MTLEIRWWIRGSLCPVGKVVTCSYMTKGKPISSCGESNGVQERDKIDDSQDRDIERISVTERVTLNYVLT